MKIDYCHRAEVATRESHIACCRPFIALLAATVLGLSPSIQANPDSGSDEWSEPQSGQSSASLYGTIDGFRHYTPQGETEGAGATLIRLRLNDGRTVVVDLGPNENLDDAGLRKGQSIQIRGHAALVEGIPAMVAESVRVNGKRITVENNPQQPAESGETQKGSENEVRQQPRQGEPPNNRARQKPGISDEAEQELNRVGNAYRQLKKAQFRGTSITDIETGEIVVKTQAAFASSFQAPNQFRHETMDMIFGSTGEQTYAFNRKTNSYLEHDLNARQALEKSLPAELIGLLHSEDPSLLAALAQRPIAQTLKLTESVEKLDDIDIDGKTCAQLRLGLKDGHAYLTAAIDPDSHLLRRVTVDLKETLKDSGSKNVKRALAIVDYSSIDTTPEFGDDQFAWTAPQGATDVTAQSQTEQSSSQKLVGQQAPDFRLRTLDGNTVSPSDLRGKVVVLDFWASWCPPCQESLPHLGQLYRERKDDAVKVFAVIMNEDRDQMQSFLSSRSLNVPVLIDRKGKVAKSYSVEAIPKTVIIGKNGKITNVFSGFGDDTFSQIKQAIEEARDEQPGNTQTRNEQSTEPSAAPPNRTTQTAAGG